MDDTLATDVEVAEVGDDHLSEKSVAGIVTDIPMPLDQGGYRLADETNEGMPKG